MILNKQILKQYTLVTGDKGDMLLRRKSDGVLFYALMRNGDNGDVEEIGKKYRTRKEQEQKGNETSV